MAKTETIEKSHGNFITFKADVEVDNCSVKFKKGYVEGFEGLNLSKWGLNIGVGIGDVSFWDVADDEECTKDCPDGSSPSKKCIKVKVTFKVIYVLLIPITRTREIGRVCANNCCCYDRQGKVVG